MTYTFKLQASDLGPIKINVELQFHSNWDPAKQPISATVDIALSPSIGSFATPQWASTIPRNVLVNSTSFGGMVRCKKIANQFWCLMTFALQTCELKSFALSWLLYQITKQWNCSFKPIPRWSSFPIARHIAPIFSSEGPGMVYMHHLVFIFLQKSVCPVPSVKYFTTKPKKQASLLYY